MNFNQTAVILLKIALQKTFHHVDDCIIDASAQGFSCAFSYSESFQEPYLKLLEADMKKCAQEEPQCMEMIPSNAREFCMHHGKKKLANSLKEVEGTIFVVRIGNQIELSEKQLQPCRHFALFSFEQKGKKVTIFGQAFEGDRQKKDALKKWRQYPKKSHAFLAKELGLYEGKIWHPRGVQLRNTLIDFWRQTVQKEGIEEVIVADPRSYYADTGRKKFGYWNGLQDSIYSFDQATLISSLQLIQKWINIFKFKCQWVFLSSRKCEPLEKALEACHIDYKIGTDEAKTPTVELHIADALGRFWTGPRLHLEKGAVCFTLFGELERFIALVLERMEGALPFWLCPEQVKLIPLKGTCFDQVIEIFNRQKIRYSVDFEPIVLKEKMHRALRAKVPYVMVFGKQEEKSKQMKVRAYGSSLDNVMTMEKLEAVLSEQQLESQ